eukprot:300497-Amphidinium_carterae.2
MKVVGVRMRQFSLQHTSTSTPAALLTDCHGDDDLRMALHAPAKAAQRVISGNSLVQTAWLQLRMTSLWCKWPGSSCAHCGCAAKKKKGEADAGTLKLDLMLTDL